MSGQTSDTSGQLPPCPLTTDRWLLTTIHWLLSTDY